MNWWGVECLMHRWSNDNSRIATPTQILTLTPTETLCVLTYITEPYTSHGTKPNCLKIHWPDLLNDTVTNFLRDHTDQGASSSDSSKLKAHLSEGDDATIYLHTTTGDGSPPEMMLTDFAALVDTSQKKQSSSPMRPAITLPPNYVPPGQPPNAPIRKSSKRTAATSFIVNSSSSSDTEEDEDNLPLKKYVAAAKKKRKRGQDQNDGTEAPPPPQKKQKTNQKKTTTAAKTKSFQVMKQWNNNTDEEKNAATPPPSDDDGLIVVEGENYIKEVKDGYDTDEDEIEPSQMDKIFT